MMKALLPIVVILSTLSLACNVQHNERVSKDEIFIRFIPPMVPDELVQKDEYGVASMQILVVGMIKRDSTLQIKEIIRLPQLSLLPQISSEEEIESLWAALEESIHTANKY